MLDSQRAIITLAILYLGVRVDIVARFAHDQVAAAGEESDGATVHTLPVNLLLAMFTAFS